MLTENAGLDRLQNRARGVDSGQCRAFHESLPIVKRVGVLAGKIQVAYGFSFITGDGGKLPRQITGVGALGQWIGWPMLQVDKKFALGIAPGGRQSAGEHLIEIAKKLDASPCGSFGFKFAPRKPLE